MPKVRKPVWIRPSVAAEMLGITRSAVVYRAGKGIYRTRRESSTDTLLVSLRDVERDVAERAERARAAESALQPTG
jgi:hypothetical protein